MNRKQTTIESSSSASDKLSFAPVSITNQSLKNFKMTNDVHTMYQPKMDETCQPSFQYFLKNSLSTGQAEQTQWGSSRPMDEVCPNNYKPHSGVPTHSVWNNLTKRRSMVNL
jgi:hypothetical protein